MENQSLVTIDGSMIAVKIHPEDVKTVISISDDDVTWLKISEAGFIEGDNFFTEKLHGIIFDMRPYWIKWNIGEAPEKIPFRSMADQPENYELRCDLKVSLADGELIGLSLAPSSARSFSKYMRRLDHFRLKVNEVVTIFKTRTVLNKQKQKFTLVDFEFIEPKPVATPQVFTVDEIASDDVPF